MPSSNPIQRYELKRHPTHGTGVLPRDDGKYMLATDHLTAMQEVEKETKEAKATIRRMDAANIAALEKVGAWDDPSGFNGVVSNIERLGARVESAEGRAIEAEQNRDLAIAHDRQPYPTADAYEKVCAARTKWQERAERLAEALEPFANIARGQHPTDPSPAVEASEKGGGRWTQFGIGLSRDRIVDWFGPSDFFAAGNAYATLADSDPPEEPLRSDAGGGVTTRVSPAGHAEGDAPKQHGGVKPDAAGESPAHPSPFLDTDKPGILAVYRRLIRLRGANSLAHFATELDAAIKELRVLLSDPPEEPQLVHFDDDVDHAKVYAELRDCAPEEPEWSHVSYREGCVPVAQDTPKEETK